MSTAPIEDYKKAILDKYERDRNGDLYLYLSDPTPKNIRERLFQMKAGNLIDKEGEVTIRNYLGLSSKENLWIELKRIDTSQFKPIQSFLKSGPEKKVYKSGILDMTALLVGYQPENKNEINLDNKESTDETSLDGTDRNNSMKNAPSVANNIVIKNILDNRIGNRWILFSVFFAVALLFLVLSGLLPVRSKEDKTNPTTNYHIENVFVSDSNRIFPDGQTQFFGNDGRPKVWYTNYNGKMEFYDTLGIHPENKEPLQPVTEEVVKVYLSDSEKEEETSKTPESNSPIAENSILVRIFDKDYGQETEATSHLSQLLAENYTITSSNNLSLERKDIENALNGEIGSLQNELGEKARFLCIGKIDFSYADSPDRESWRKCTLSLNYSITDLKTGQIVNSNHKTFYGIGSSDTSAKTNTIKKIAL